MWVKFTDIRTLNQTEGPDVTLINLSEVTKIVLSPNIENVLFYDENGEQLHAESPGSIGEADFKRLVTGLGDALEIPETCTFGTK